MCSLSAVGYVGGAFGEKLYLYHSSAVYLLTAPSWELVRFMGLVDLRAFINKNGIHIKGRLWLTEGRVDATFDIWH